MSKLTPARRRVLEEIRDAGPEGLGFGRSPTYMRRRLEANGLIERVGTPRVLEVIRHRLTDAGRAALEGK
jgi:hypothetical protein